MYVGYLKRTIDLALSLLLLMALSPLLIIISIALLVFQGRPIFFIQRRPGKNTKIFNLIKFRTMDNVGKNASNSTSRITTLGRILRESSLDEVPELYNVIIGDMSLVGPRPLLEEYLPLYNHEQIKRHDVLPGITGLAQVKGRNRLSWEEKFNLDLEYINNISFFLDLKILFMTLVSVVSRDSVNQSEDSTMEKFKG